MQLTLNKYSALRILRALRCGKLPSHAPANRARGKGDAAVTRSPLDAFERIDVRTPDPSPRKRWTNAALRDMGLAFLANTTSSSPAGQGDRRIQKPDAKTRRAFGAGSKPAGGSSAVEDPVEKASDNMKPRARVRYLERIYVATADPDRRLQWSRAVNTVYARDAGLPAGSFIDLGHGLAISSPELLFAEMAAVMDIPHLVLLGFELCGSFSRNPDDPRNGNGRMNVAPVTSVEAIRSFIEQAKWLRGSDRAALALEYVRDNAWSPTEAIAATMLLLPAGEFGYELDDCTLNVRVEASQNLTAFNDRESRVPDMLLCGTRVGFNYDGAVHLNLKEVVGAAQDAERHPDEPFAQTELERVMREVRAKVVDDIRRNRELAAAGYVVFPITKEDLYEEGGFDRIVMQAIEAIEAFDSRNMSETRRLVNSRYFKAKRQQLIWSLLPGAHEKRMAHASTRSGGELHPAQVIEVMIGF